MNNFIHFNETSLEELGKFVLAKCLLIVRITNYHSLNLKNLSLNRLLPNIYGSISNTQMSVFDCCCVFILFYAYFSFFISTQKIKPIVFSSQHYILILGDGATFAIQQQFSYMNTAMRLQCAVLVGFTVSIYFSIRY